MTNLEINQAIAVLLGWKYVDNDPDYEPYWAAPKDHPRHGHNMAAANYPHLFPSYSTDLNIMHEAEKKLGEGLDGLNNWIDYLQTLYDIAQQPHICPLSHNVAYVCATARQRAEAFLRVFGKWVEPITPPEPEAPEWTDNQPKIEVNEQPRHNPVS